MPRQPRIQDEYMIHHVVARGNRKEKVFHSDGDYIRYLQLLERYRDRYNFHLFSYCLMDNHVHLLVQQSTTPLSKFMQGIQQSYTQYFNKKHTTSGHVFQQRYTSYPCTEDAYLISLIAYIHKNPKSAGLVPSVADYRWSSHQEILQHSTKNLIDADALFALIGRTRKEILPDYLRWIDEVDEEIIENQYMSKEEKELARANADFVKLEQKIAKKKYKLPIILSLIDQYQKARSIQLHPSDYRKILTVLCDRYSPAKTKDIAAETGVVSSRISAIRKEHAEGQFPPQLLLHIDNIIARIEEEERGQA
ncbi:MAG: hypothetical protein GX291_02325 [Tissierellia bacterium]|jgi:putative transposase|nr:transposase [Bacillota bacterium]NLK58089.1 hypothetical protein [Tissierellia bacterium]